MKRSTLILSILMVASILLAACSQGAGPQPATEPDPAAQAKIATLEAQLTEAEEGSVSEEEVAKLQEDLEAAKAEAEAAKAEAEAASEAAGAAVGANYERSETLYTSGTQWGPPTSWNPLITWGHATGTVGLCYETLFLYDPLTNEYQPWLAESGGWTSDNVYELKLREGLTWQDGESLTAEDVVFTFELGQYPSVYYSPLWDWLESAEAVDEHTVEFTFSDPLYQEWANTLYSLAIVPKHDWEGRSEEEISSGANENPICSGAYTYETHSQDRMVWSKNEDWWAQEALGLEVAPTRIVDIVNSNNSVALGLVLQGQIDLSNNFLPGVASLVNGGYGLETYYDEAPYMVSANTAWLVMNTTKPPMDDPAFRKALAHAIDVNQIVEKVYGNIVQAANPTGLLPIWDEFVDQTVVEEHGFSFDPEVARTMLADAGYTDTDGDGFVETPDGSPIELSLIVPNGWTDWMEAIRVISTSAKAVGINIKTEFPDFPGYADARNSGKYDMAISNEAQMSNTVWTYYDWLFQEPVQETMTNGNYSRYENQELFDLVEQLDKTPVDDTEGMKEIVSQIQQIQLSEMPAIPLWYNGLWSQYNTKVWTNWPTASEDTPNYLPASWRGYWNMGSILMLTELEPAPAEE